MKLAWILFLSHGANGFLLPTHHSHAIGTNAKYATRDVDLDKVSAEMEAALQAAQEALEEELQTERQSQNLDLSELLQQVDSALDTAKEAIADTEQASALQDSKDNLIDADRILGEKAKDVVELLSRGFMDSASFHIYIEQRQEEARQVRQQQAEKAKEHMRQKEQEALLLKQEIRRAAVHRMQRERFGSALTVGFDASLIGCLLGLFAWAALPDLLGDNVAPVIPMAVGSAALGCAAIVASTTEGPVGNLFQKLPIGMASRGVLSAFSDLGSAISGTVEATVDDIEMGISDAIDGAKTKAKEND